MPAKGKHLPQLAGQRAGQSRDLSTTVAAKCCPVRPLPSSASACLSLERRLTLDWRTILREIKILSAGEAETDTRAHIATIFQLHATDRPPALEEFVRGEQLSQTATLIEAIVEARTKLSRSPARAQSLGIRPIFGRVAKSGRDFQSRARRIPIS